MFAFKCGIVGRTTCALCYSLHTLQYIHFEFLFLKSRLNWIDIVMCAYQQQLTKQTFYWKHNLLWFEWRHSEMTNCQYMQKRKKKCKRNIIIMRAKCVCIVCKFGCLFEILPSVYAFFLWIPPLNTIRTIESCVCAHFTQCDEPFGSGGTAIHSRCAHYSAVSVSLKIMFCVCAIGMNNYCVRVHFNWIQFSSMDWIKSIEETENIALLSYTCWVIIETFQKYFSYEMSFDFCAA